MTNSQAIQFNDALSTILTEGLNVIKESLTRDTKSLNYNNLHSIYDDLNYLLKEPLDYIQDIVGYIEDLQEEALEDLNNVEKAVVSLGFYQERYNEVNDLLKQIVPNITEYKVLIDKLNSK